MFLCETVSISPGCVRHIKQVSYLQKTSENIQISKAVADLLHKKALLDLLVNIGDDFCKVRTKPDLQLRDRPKKSFDLSIKFCFPQCETNKQNHLYPFYNFSPCPFAQLSELVTL